MGTLYFDTGGSATNSGSTDQNSANLSGAAATVASTVVTLDGSPDLSGVVTSGATQSTIYLNDATNSNQKIFWITAFDDTLNTVTVSVAPTGVTSSAWAIGGRHVMTPASWEGAIRAGDTVIINNSPAGATGDRITARVAGSSADGPVRIMGKAGTRPVINCTDTNQCIDIAAIALWEISNFELDQDGASGNVFITNSARCFNIKIVDGGGVGCVLGGTAKLINASITGVGGDGITTSTTALILGCNIHDVTGDGIELNTANPTGIFIEKTIVDTCAARGIYFSSGVNTTAGVVVIDNCTVYGCGNTGVEVDDIDAGIILTNSILSENGNGAGEFNFEQVAGTAERIGFHAWNVFFHTSGAGSNLSNATANHFVTSSEFTTNPQFTNAAGADFSIANASPAAATGFPGTFLD